MPAKIIYNDSTVASVDPGQVATIPTKGNVMSSDIVVDMSRMKGGSYDEGVEAGRQAEYDAFWDAYQQGGTRTDYYYAFSGHGWTDEAFKPKYPIICGTAIAAFHENTGITRVPVSVELLSGVSASNLFAFCSKLKTIQLLKLCGNNVFNNNAFQNCTALESVTIEGEISSSLNLSWSSKLSSASVQSIIDCLKDLTGATAQTLTLHSTVGGNMTPEQKAAITAKNWTLVY